MTHLLFAFFVFFLATPTFGVEFIKVRAKSARQIRTENTPNPPNKAGFQQTTAYLGVPVGSIPDTDVILMYSGQIQHNENNYHELLDQEYSSWGILLTSSPNFFAGKIRWLHRHVGTHEFFNEKRLKDTIIAATYDSPLWGFSTPSIALRLQNYQQAYMPSVYLGGKVNLSDTWTLDVFLPAHTYLTNFSKLSTYGIEFGYYAESTYYPVVNHHQVTFAQGFEAHLFMRYCLRFYKSLYGSAEASSYFDSINFLDGEGDKIAAFSSFGGLASKIAINLQL